MKTNMSVFFLGLIVSLLSAVGVSGQVGQTPLNQSALVTIATGQNAPTFGLTIAPAPGLTVAQASKRTLPTYFRVAGPSLKKINVPNYAAKPSLVVYDSTGKVIATNNGWNNDPVIKIIAAQVGAFPFEPANDSEYDSALLLELPIGSYTVQVIDPTSVGKRALIEIYNADRLPTTGILRFSNLSVRGMLPMTVGLTFDGTGSKPFLFRTIGQTLGLFGVTGASEDTRMAIYSAQGAMVIENDNWNSNLAPTFAKVGAFPLSLGSKDSALLYNVVSRGPLGFTMVAEGAGVALIEVYEVPSS